MRTFFRFPAGSAARNPRILELHAPFRSVTFSGAYLPLFLIGHGLTPNQIIILEAMFFSGFWVMWELPSSWLADKIGHARSIQLSVPFAALGFGLYGMSSQFWQFCVMELLIGIAQGLLSGSDAALMRESLIATGDTHKEAWWQHKVSAASKLSYMIGAIGSIAIVWLFGVAATLIVDGLVIMLGLPLVMQLKEVEPADNTASGFRQTLRAFLGNKEVRAFMRLSTGLSMVTYFAVWLTAIYYQQIGITVTVIGVISFFKQFGMRQLSKWMSRQAFHYRHWWWLIGLAAGTTAAYMLPMTWWLVPAFVGFDVIRTIALPETTTRMNELIEGRYRASMHSILTMVCRGAFVLFGFPIQWIASSYGIQAAMSTASALGLGLAIPALIRLRKLNIRR